MSVAATSICAPARCPITLTLTGKDEDDVIPHALSLLQYRFFSIRAVDRSPLGTSIHI